MRTAVGAAIIDNGNLLLVKEEDVWILPGGQHEKGESDLECLCREIREELSGTEIDNPHFYGEFVGKTPHKGDYLAASVYFAKIRGELGKPSGEISEAQWIQYSGLKNYNISDITLKIIQSLNEGGYLRVK